MKRISFLLFSSFSSAAWGEAVTLKGPDITALLSDNRLYGVGAAQPTSQLFLKNGATFYNVGSAQQQGAWKVKDDQYCSLWPPSQSWACYYVVRDGAVIRFQSMTGSETAWTTQP